MIGETIDGYIRRVARKSHTCAACGTEIRPGTAYADARLETDDGLYAYREHQFCNAKYNQFIAWTDYSVDDGFRLDQEDFRTFLRTKFTQDILDYHNVPVLSDGVHLDFISDVAELLEI